MDLEVIAMKKYSTLTRFGLVWFYGIPTIVGYLMPNLFIDINSSISNNSVKHKYSFFFVYTQLNVKTSLFQTIQFSIGKQFKWQKQFYFKQFSLASVQLSSIWLLDRTLSGATTLGRVDLGAMAIKEYSAFPKAPALLEPHYQCPILDTRWDGGLTVMHRCSRSILRPQRTGLHSQEL